METAADALDPLIKAAPPGTTPPPPWVVVRFDQQGRPAAPFVRADRLLLVNPRRSAECTVEFSAPEIGTPSVAMTAELRLSCPLHEEIEVARRLYDHERTPKQMIDRYVAQTVREHIARIGRDAFLNGIEHEVERELCTQLERRLPVLTRLHVEILRCAPVRPVLPVITVKLDGHAVDLADNGVGVPLGLSVALAVDRASAAMRAKARLRGDRQEDLQRPVTEFVERFFRGVSSADLFDSTKDIEWRLKAQLAQQAAAWGRIVTQLALARPPDTRVKPVDAAFVCWLADGTNLQISVSGALWITAPSSETPSSSNESDPWPRLAEILKVRARALLSPQGYFEFQAHERERLHALDALVQDDAARMGVGARLSFRAEWSHAWLLNGIHVDDEVACTVGRELSDGKVRVWLECRVGRNAVRPQWPRMSRTQVEEAIKELIASVVRQHVGLISMLEYIEFTSLKAAIVRDLSGRIPSQLGLEVSSLQLQRLDDWFRQTLATQLKEAPLFTVAHPRWPALKFEVQFRFVETVIESGTPFPVYPTDIEQLKTGVEGCILEFLNEISPADAEGLENQRRLRDVALRAIPECVQKKHFARIDLLRWRALPLPSALPGQLEKLLAKLKELDATNWQRPALVLEVSRVASAMEKAGDRVPWIELEAYGIQRPQLGPGPAEPKQLAAPEPQSS